MPVACFHKFYVHGFTIVNINNRDLGIGTINPSCPLHVPGTGLFAFTTTNTKGYIATNGISSSTISISVIANFAGNIWYSLGTILYM